MKTADVVGIEVIAHRTGVSKATVRQWRQRFGDFPTPNRLGTATGAGSTPWWDWRDVEQFLTRHPHLGRRDL